MGYADAVGLGKQMPVLVEFDLRVGNSVDLTGHRHVLVVLDGDVLEGLEKDGRVGLLQVEVVVTLAVLVGCYYGVEAFVLLGGVGDVEVVEIVVVCVDSGS